MRKSFVLFAVVAMLALALSACGPTTATITAEPMPHTLNVNGAGQVFLTPDVAYIYIGVHTEDQSATSAVSENTDKATAIAQALQDFGVDPKDIRTTNFSIYPYQQFGMDGMPTGVTTYAVDNTVYVTVRDLSQLGELLDGVVQAGANTINSITFDVSDRISALSEARTAAVENAVAIAEELADAAGVELGDVVNISYYDATPYPMYDTFAGKGGGGGAPMEAAVPVNPGQMSLTVTVSITYEIK